MFRPKRIIFEKDVLNYEIAKNIQKYFQDKSDVEMIYLTNNRIKENIPGVNLYEQYRNGKQTLVVDTKKSLKFQTCKPSANYQLPLVSGCMGQCEYCYLNTNMGDKPFIRAHVNIKGVLEQADQYMKLNEGNITIFEGAATSDPVPIEYLTHALKTTIQFFSESEMGRFRFVTKYDDVDDLLTIHHNGHTEIRFSVNTDTVIRNYEKGTASLDRRIEAANKLMHSDYPVGFLIAPVFIYDNWQEEYLELLSNMKSILPTSSKYPITFEVISHRYTTIAKNRILEIFPDTRLPMDEKSRRYQYGQFGYGKYVYDKVDMASIKDFFKSNINHFFPDAEVKYII